MKPYEGMSEDQIRILNLEARLHLQEAQTKAFYRLVSTVFANLQLKTIQGVSPDTFVQQESERILQETLRGLADHDPIHANQIASILADVKKALPPAPL